MRANAPEWEPGRRDTLETLLSDFVPPFPASGRRNVGALPRKVSSCQTGVWDDAIAGTSRIIMTVVRDWCNPRTVASADYLYPCQSWREFVLSPNAVARR